MLGEFEVIDAERPTRIVERNLAHKAKRTGEGTYLLESVAAGTTRITFTYAWIVTPLMDRVTTPVLRKFMRRNNETSMLRLAELLTPHRPGASPMPAQAVEEPGVVAIET